jgi:hypothetical protein
VKHFALPLLLLPLPVLVAAGALAAAQGSAPTAQAPQPLTLMYNRHAAYHEQSPNGQVEGLLATPVAGALARAHVAFRWQEIPVARQRAILEGNLEPACVLGALKTPERERIGKFSHPLYQAQPIVALSLANNPLLNNGRTLQHTLRQPQIRLLAKEGYTFGSYVTAALAQNPVQTVSTNTEVPNMVGMLVHQRADFFFLAEDAFPPLIQKSGYKPELFKITRFTDMPAGNPRYLWCTEQVPDAMLSRLNADFDRLYQQSVQRASLEPAR